jgi:methionyl-tRNA formyltransferase
MVEIVFLGVNDVGKQVYDWLTDRDDATVRALLTEPDQLDLVTELQPDLLVSAGFRAIVPADVLAVPDRGAVNLHKSYLPYNRGANPNVWSIVEDNPAGVSIHYMTADVDAGPIIDRRKVPVRPDDDGRDLYERLEAAQFEQFTDCWPAIRDDTADTVDQDSDAGTDHYKQDFVDLWEIDRDEQVLAGDLIDRLRALTFEPYRNAYFEVDDTRYWVELSVTSADELDRDGDGATAKNVPRYTEDGEN